MAKYLSHIDLNQNQLQNAVVHPLGSAPSTPVEGQIYFNSTAGNKKLYVYNGTAWTDLAGVYSISNGDGISVSGSSGSVTISVDASATYFEFVSGELSIKAGSIGATELAATTVTAGSYGSGSAIPTFTVDADGRLTAAGSVGISSTLDIAADAGTDDGVVLGTDTLTISGGTNINTSVSGDTITVNLDASPTISGDLVVEGNLTVSGATQTKISETVLIEDNIITLNSNEAGTPSEDGGIEIERGTATNVSLIWDESADRWAFTNDGSTFYNIPVPSEYDNYNFNVSDGTTSTEVADGGTVTISGGNAINATNVSGTITIDHADTSSQASVDNSGFNVIQDITLDTYGHITGINSVDVSGAVTAREYAATISATATVTHNLGSRDVIVQLFDTVTYETVFADVERSTTNAVDVTFASTPTNDGSTFYNIPVPSEYDNYNFNVSDGTTSTEVADGGTVTISGGNAINATNVSGTITIDHADTSSQASVDNSGFNVIQDITLDTYGHITGINSVNVTGAVTAREHAATISATATVTHNLGSRDVIVQLFDTVTYETVFADVERSTTNAVDVTFASTPTNDVRVLISKIG